MRLLIEWALLVVASLILVLGLLFIFLPGPAIIILPLGIWLFNKIRPGKLDPYLKRFMAFNQRLARRLDRWFSRS
jgi:hypothetical protein